MRSQCHWQFKSCFSWYSVGDLETTFIDLLLLELCSNVVNRFCKWLERHRGKIEKDLWSTGLLSQWQSLLCSDKGWARSQGLLAGLPCEWHAQGFGPCSVALPGAVHGAGSELEQLELKPVPCGPSATAAGYLIVPQNQPQMVAIFKDYEFHYSKKMKFYLVLFKFLDEFKTCFCLKSSHHWSVLWSSWGLWIKYYALVWPCAAFGHCPYSFKLQG